MTHLLSDILLVRMTSDLTRAPEKRFGYSNVFTGLMGLMKTEGFRGLTRGLGTNTVRSSD
jgi:dicarboxylate transporter 10